MNPAPKNIVILDSESPRELANSVQEFLDRKDGWFPVEGAHPYVNQFGETRFSITLVTCYPL